MALGNVEPKLGTLEETSVKTSVPVVNKLVEVVRRIPVVNITLGIHIGRFKVTPEALVLFIVIELKLAFTLPAVNAHKLEE